MDESSIMTFFLDNSVFVTFIYTEKGKIMNTGSMFS